MAKKPTTRKTSGKKPQARKQHTSGYLQVNGSAWTINGPIDPGPEDWWVDRAEGNLGRAIYRARKQPDGVSPHNDKPPVFWSGPFTESKAKSEADRLNEQFYPVVVTPKPEPAWEQSIPSWTVAAVAGAAIASGFWFIFI